MSSFGVFPDATEAEVRRHKRAAVRPSAEDEAQAARINAALKCSCDLLYSLQNAEGWWCGDLTADSTLESDYVLLQLWLHQPGPGAWNPPTRGRVDRACKSVLDRQLPDGGWNLYPGGPSDISATVKAYSALRIAGCPAEAEALVRARKRILDLGGIQAANSYT